MSGSRHRYVWLILAVAAAMACAPSEPPVTSEAVARIQAARREAAEAAVAARAAQPTPQPPEDEDEEEDDASRAPSAETEQVTLEPEGGVQRPQTLGEAAAAARAERREQGERATVVITNDNLADYAAEGQVTVATVPDAAEETAATPGEDAAKGTSATSAAETSLAEEPLGGPRDEEYWRGRAREIRTRWAAAAEEVETLEAQAAQLRWDFYAADDPYYRDQRIKPQWDRVLDELRRARQDIRAYRRELDDLLDEGREQGALPGWLREGVELEPELTAEEEEAQRRTTTESVEPEAYPESGIGDPGQR